MNSALRPSHEAMEVMGVPLGVRVIARAAQQAQGAQVDHLKDNLGRGREE